MATKEGVNMSKKLGILLVVILLCISLLWVVFNAVEIWNYSKIDETAESDVAIVLGAATYDGEVSPVFRERINHAVELYKNGTVKVIIMTGGIGEGNSISDALAGKNYAVSKGVKEEHILIEEKSTITQENLIYSKEIMDNNGYETALLVSDPLHMKRAMLLAENSGIDCNSSPTTTSRYISLKSKLKFLCREVFYYTGYKIVAGF